MSIDIKELRSMVNGAQFESFANSVIHSLLDRLEAAEKERDALRTKIEQMERQGPVAFGLYSGWALKATYLKEHEACEQRDRRQLTADLGGSIEAYRVAPLYALPGAHPAPSVPDVPAKSLKPVIDWLRNGCDPMTAADELEILIAAAPEAKP